MDDHVRQAVKALVERCGAVVQQEFRQQTTVTLAAEKNVEALRILRDDFRFDMLMDVTAVDYLDQEPRFHVVYQLYAREKNSRLTVRVPVSGKSPHLSTVESVFVSANWYEREVWDMFGIRFDGHSDLRRIIMPADWQGHPLRKDYPLGYEEVQFTFNYEEIDLHKPQGKEM